jgi:tetratricopeptide (TPR) repeat protein
MKPEVAQRRIAAFRERFGEAHYHFACHAAFPLALTPDLLYRLWANFQRDIQGKSLEIPWMAVADVLLSGLCDEVGQELYEMRLPVRSALLNELKTGSQFGMRRIHELSDFLLMYVQQQLESPDLDQRDVAQTQRWIALAYLQPDQAAYEVACALAKLNFKEKSEWLRLTSLVGTFAEPIAKFKPLLTYMHSIENFIRGDVINAARQLGTFAENLTDSIQVSGISLPIPIEVQSSINYVKSQRQKDQVIQKLLKILPSIGESISFETTQTSEKLIQELQELTAQLTLLASTAPHTFTATDYIKQGQAFYFECRYDEALKSYEKALDTAANNSDAWFGKGKALKRLRRYEEAVFCFEKVLKLDPNVYAAWVELGSAHRWMKHLDLAINSCNQAINLNPDYARAWYNRACYYAICGEVTIALQDLQEAIRLTPDDKCKVMAGIDSDFDLIRQHAGFKQLINHGQPDIAAHQPVYCNGIAKLHIAETGEVFEVTSDVLEWETECSELDRGMGPEWLHSATINFESRRRSNYQVSATWQVWEYPIGTLDHAEISEIEGGELLQDFDDYRLTEERQDFDVLIEEELINESETFSSNRNPSYPKLESFLKEEQWKEADVETLLILLKEVGREEYGWLDVDSIQQIPCSVIITIDQLWIRYSRSQFGFSVQKQIYIESGGQTNSTAFIEPETLSAFGARVGWIHEWGLIPYEDMNFSLAAPVGHLPAGGGMLARFPELEYQLAPLLVAIFSRLENCSSTADIQN